MRAISRKISFLFLSLTGLIGCAQNHATDLSSTDRAAFSNPIADNTPLADSDRTKPKTLFETGTNGSQSPNLERFVQKGTGRRIGQPAPLRDDAVVVDAAGDIALNVVDADVREVVRLILDDGLGANYVIDPAVTGSITIRTSRSVPADEILPLLSSVLQANGAALIEREGLFQILPLEKAAASGGRPSTRLSLQAGKPGSGILVAPLRFTEPGALAELLQPLVAPSGSVQVDGERNTLLVIGSPDQIVTIGDLIDILDVDWMAGMSIGFYPLERAQASDLAFELEQIFGLNSEEGAGDQPLRFVPIDRLNAFLVIATEATLLRRVEDWINRLDRVGEGDEDQIYVYPVQNGRASDLASVLGELFDIRSTAVGPDPLLAPGLEPIEFGSSLLDNDQDADLSGEEQVGAVRRGAAARRRSNDQAPLGPRDLTGDQGDDGTKIVADEANNSLLIRATPKDYRKIETALRELDKPPLQVLLEATIAEVSLRDELSYGVQWFFNAGSTDFTLSERTSGAVDAFFPGFSGILSSGDVRVVIDALESVSDVNVISSPQILVLDNQTARLEVGDEVPIVTRQSEGVDDDDARVINTVEQRQTGVILDVTPRVNANGLVVLDIEQEVSDVVLTTTSGIDSPTIAQRRIGTTVAVDSDETIALGGLIQDDADQIRSGIPFLSSIPVLGWLFGSTTTISERTELLVLITPKVLEDTSAAVEATDELRRRLRRIAPLEAKITDPLADQEEDRASADQVLGSPAMPRESSDRQFLAQLPTFKTEPEAALAWLSYQERHSVLLDGVPHNIEPFVIDGEEGFRLQIGPLASFGDADDLCDQLPTSDDDCLVVEFVR